MVAPPLLLRLPLHPVALQQPPLLLLRLVVPPRLRLQLLLLVEVRNRRLVQQGRASINKPQLQVWSHAVDVTAACKPPISCQSQASGQWKLAPSPT